MSKILIRSNNEMSEGLFGMVILFLFEVLSIFEENKTNINSLFWDISTISYGSIFPNILEYNNEYLPPNSNFDKQIKLSDLRRSQIQYVLGDDFIKLNNLFFKYFKIPEQLLEISNSYKLENYLGIHFRGSDKTTDTNMNTPITKNDFYTIIDSYINKNNIIRIFLATDESDILNYFKSKYNNIHFLSSRDFNTNLFWRNNNNVENNSKEAMIDMLCLSKCDTVLKVSSALSSFSKLINPNLKIFRLNALKMFADIPYFPDAYIPLLEKNVDYTENCNNILDKIQKDDWSYNNSYNFNNFYYKVR